MKRALLAAVVMLALVPATRGASGTQFDLSMGYAHLNLSGSDRFENRDGFRIEPRVSFSPSDERPQFRLGFGLGISGYSHQLEDGTVIIIDDGDVDTFDQDQWESVSLIVPEFQISWKQPIGDAWFVEPGVGVGAVFANYYIAKEFWWLDDDDVSEWDTTFGVRPFVRVGWQNDHWVIGGEASYLWGGSISLIDEVEGDVGELYVGGFFGYRW